MASTNNAMLFTFVHRSGSMAVLGKEHLVTSGPSELSYTVSHPPATEQMQPMNFIDVRLSRQNALQLDVLRLSGERGSILMYATARRYRRRQYPFGELYDRQHWAIAALRNRSKTSARLDPSVE